MSAIFDPGQAQEIARALAAVAAADGAILSREESFLDEFAMRHSVAGHAFFSTTFDVDRLARAIRDPEQRKEVVRLCLRMALADGNYAPAEVRMVEQIAAALAITPDELAALTAAASSPSKS